MRDYFNADSFHSYEEGKMTIGKKERKEVAHLSLKLLIDRVGVRSESQGQDWLMSSVDRTIDVRPAGSESVTSPVVGGGG